jgi:lipoate-protein ligase B
MQHPPSAKTANGSCWWLDLGRMDYERARRLQRRFVDYKARRAMDRDLLLFVEHPPVYTLGNRGSRDRNPADDDSGTLCGIPLVSTERGGDITYHGPGQLVAYPIFDLKSSSLGVKSLVYRLEQAMIDTAASFGVTAKRSARNPGVWVHGSKLGSIGIAVRRSISFHGIALNVDNDLEPFTWIDPCGLEGVSMTSLKLAGADAADLVQARAAMLDAFERVFCCSFAQVRLNHLLPAFEADHEP